jgi:hypothetical protein
MSNNASKVIDRTKLNQDNCFWDDLDYQALKMWILEEGTSAATLHKYLPWRSRKNIERKLKSQETLGFIKKWSKYNSNLANTEQLKFDQSIIKRKRGIEAEEIFSVDKSPAEVSLTNKNNNNGETQRNTTTNSYEKYLQRPRIDCSKAEYYISYRHSLRTEFKWKVLDCERGTLECEVIDYPWEEKEWVRILPCKSLSYINSSKNQLKHSIPFQAPIDAVVGGRKVVMSYTQFGAITTLVLPRQLHNRPGEIECEVIYTQEFSEKIEIPTKPKLSYQPRPSELIGTTLRPSNIPSESQKEKTDEPQDFVFRDKIPAVGDKIKVWFSEKDRYYKGKIVFFDNSDNSYSVQYAGGWQDDNIDLAMDNQTNDVENQERWEYID